MSVVLSDEDFQAIKQALKVGDDLCTTVIAGKPGATKVALEYVRTLNDIKRRKVIEKY